ncbi:MAG: tartrate dehydrogenase [Verrucomicrobia bacterium]|nr:tartrate dehydrogenase [Verrucomicrobiota bacterium]
MKEFKIAVYPGDGIGPEVVDEAVRISEAVQNQTGEFILRLTRLTWGADYWKATGQVVPDNFLEILKPFDAIFFGAAGDPMRIPDHITLEPLVHIRQEFDQYACVRPARLYRGVTSPLVIKTSSEIDFVVVRENSEGEYVNMGGRFKVGHPEELALQTAVHTRRGIERILRFGFHLAQTRRRRLTMITKSNAQRYAFVLWDEILDEMRHSFPDVSAEKQHVDAAAMNFVRCPERFDVVVASNLFGDILTDLGGIISGGLGLAPSANLNPERKFPSLFEPVHGSAPDIAGKGIANPVAAILSAAMMLEWLSLAKPAAAIKRAVETALNNGARTPDLGGKLSTRQMGDQIISHLQPVI